MKGEGLNPTYKLQSRIFSLLRGRVRGDRRKGPLLNKTHPENQEFANPWDTVAVIIYTIVCVAFFTAFIWNHNGRKIPIPDEPTDISARRVVAPVIDFHQALRGE
jgi:hypothetical protein